MQPFVIANHNKTGITVGGYFLHKIVNGVDIFCSTSFRNDGIRAISSACIFARALISDKAVG